MKIIDLLNKIANGEEVPKKFKIKGSCFKDLYFEYDEKHECYDLIGENFKNGCYTFGYSELNDEIEIIEENKIPEKLETYFDVALEEYTVETYINGVYYKEIFNSRYDEMIISKLNEIIDYLKSKGE